MTIIAPSILSADFADLKTDIGSVEKGGAGLIHIDVMDGHFVPNITVGPVVVECIRKITRLPLDVHLMIEEPIRYIPAFLRAGANFISVHYEADAHLNRTVNAIKDGGAKAGVAINPATPIDHLAEIISDLDFVLTMTVNPGFGGQKFIESAYDKIRRLKAFIKGRSNARIEVDGGIGPDNLRQVIAAGADIVVSGSAIFNAHDPGKVVQQMYRMIEVAM